MQIKKPLVTVSCEYYAASMCRAKAARWLRQQRADGVKFVKAAHGGWSAV